MVARWVHPKKLNVQCVREPRQRVPVGLLRAAEGPGDGGPVQSGFHVSVSRDVAVVIEVHKLVSRHSAVNQKRQQYEQETKGNLVVLVQRQRFLLTVRRARFDVGQGHEEKLNTETAVSEFNLQ